VVIETQVQVDFTDYDTSTDLYNGVTKLLDNAAKSGTFTDRMRFIASTLSASDLADAEATQVSSDAPTVTEAPGSSQKTATKYKLVVVATVAFILGVAVTVVVFLLVNIKITPQSPVKAPTYTPCYASPVL
jgi:hypothetical protein